MANTLAIVSKKLFEAEHAGAAAGDIRPIDIYRSQNRGLDSLSRGESLFLVTVRPDESLWLVAELIDPKRGRDGWRSAVNSRPIRDITALIPKITFDTGKGISAAKGRLGMSLQTPRKLTDADVALLRGTGATKPRAAKPKTAKKTAKPKTAKPKTAKPRTAKPKTAKPKTAQAPAPSVDQLRAILDARMEVAIPQLRDLIGRADRSTLDAMFELGWFDIGKWRSTEAMLYWVYSYFIALRFGTASDVPRLAKLPERDVYSQAHEDVDRARTLVAEILVRRANGHDGPRPTKLPRAKAKLAAYIDARIGDPSWDDTAALVALVESPRFALESIDGLRVYAALLDHGRPETLGPLVPLAPGSTIIAQILAHAGIDASGKADPNGEALLASIYADPDDDHARAVYADWLIERGEPRGEFINAQLMGREPKLADLDAVTWSGLGELLRWQAQYAGERGAHRPRYRRGFISGAYIDALDGELLDRPQWATVELLDVASSIEDIERYPLTSLRALGWVSDHQVPMLVESKLSRQLVAVGLPCDLTRELADLLATLPSLRAVAFPRLARRSLATHRLFERLDLAIVDGRSRGDEHNRDLGDKTTVVRGTDMGRLLPNYDRIVPFFAD